MLYTILYLLQLWMESSSAASMSHVLDGALGLTRCICCLSKRRLTVPDAFSGLWMSAMTRLLLSASASMELRRDLRSYMAHQDASITSIEAHNVHAMPPAAAKFGCAVSVTCAVRNRGPSKPMPAIMAHDCKASNTHTALYVRELNAMLQLYHITSACWPSHP